MLFIWLCVHKMIGNGEKTQEIIRMDKIRMKKHKSEII